MKHITAATEAGMNRKPCVSCGNLISGFLYCVQCQRENMLQFFKAKPWLRKEGK